MLKIKINLKEGNYVIQIKNKNSKKSKKKEFDNKCKAIFLQTTVFDEGDIKNFIILVKNDYSKKVNIKDIIIIYKAEILDFS